MFKNKFVKRVLFIGMPDMAYICLEGLHRAGVNIVGVMGAKRDHPTYTGFKNFVRNHHLNFINYDELDDIFLIKKIKDLNADIAIVCSFNYKIPKALLETVKDGFINVHPSLLPKYRGPNPYSAVIINGEKETGITLHFMTEEFDRGDIIAQKKIAVMKNETMGTLFNRTNIVALDMISEVLKEYETNGLKAEKQPHGNYKTGKILKEKELFINFKKTSAEIDALTRALNPFVLARTNFRGTLTKILTVELSNEISKEKVPPGTIVKIEKDKFYVKTGDGLIVLTSMQFGSFFAGTSKEFIEILNPRIGEKFE
ncbi:MAG: methionyl-tRNA formyltransferase [Candidatus Gastranaerophilales bacterium]|nr:methionyl-tRNA formyltransferase [Candidatus Gastranaerophilales bacterium]